MLTAPPICTQVSVPSTLTKPTPKAAQLLYARLAGGLAKVAAFSALSSRSGSAAETGARDVTTMIAGRIKRIAPCSAHREGSLPDEFDAQHFPAAPDHFAIPPGPGIARKRQPQPAAEHVGIFHGD